MDVNWVSSFFCSFVFAVLCWLNLAYSLESLPTLYYSPSFQSSYSAMFCRMVRESRQYMLVTMVVYKDSLYVILSGQFSNLIHLSNVQPIFRPSLILFYWCFNYVFRIFLQQSSPVSTLWHSPPYLETHFMAISRAQLPKL